MVVIIIIIYLHKKRVGNMQLSVTIHVNKKCKMSGLITVLVEYSY